MNRDNSMQYDEWADRERWWFDYTRLSEGMIDAGDLILYGEESYDERTGKWLNDAWIKSEIYYDSQKRR